MLAKDKKNTAEFILIDIHIIIWVISGRGLFVPDFIFQKVEAMVVLTISACLCYYFELTNEIRFLTLDQDTVLTNLRLSQTAK